MKTELVIFDLDGTLLDTIGDLAASCNHVLGECGYPQYSLAEYRGFVGNGVKRLIERALPDGTPDKEVERIRAKFVKYYAAHIAADTHPYEGVPQLLRSLVSNGVKVAVASNKFHSGTVDLMRIFFPEIPFACVLGQRPPVPLKPDPAVVFETMQVCGVEDASKVVFVGDSGIDMDTAAAASVRSIGVSWGFRSVEELQEHGAWKIVSSADEIAAVCIG